MDTAARGYADTPPHDTQERLASLPGENDRDLPVPAPSTALDVPREGTDSGAGTSESSGIQAKVTQRPLLAVGAGLIGGIVLGGLLGGGGDRRHDARTRSGGTHYTTASGGSTSESGSDQSGASSGSVTHSMTEGLRKAAKQSGLEERSRSATTSAASSLNDTLRSVLSKQLPGFDERLRERQQGKG